MTQLWIIINSIKSIAKFSMKDKLGIWYLSSPVSTQDDHEEYDNDPEQLSDQSLVAEEDVDDALDGRVLRVVLHPISLNVSEWTDGFINFSDNYVEIKLSRNFLGK